VCYWLKIEDQRQASTYMTRSFHCVLEAAAARNDNDETTVDAFSPDGKSLFLCFQEIDLLFKIQRADDLPFDGRRRKK
jgi:hypothetical protein